MSISIPGAQTPKASFWTHPGVRAVGLVLALIAAIRPATALVEQLGGTLQMVGRNIPSNHIPYDYAIGVLWAWLLGLSILVWPIPIRDRMAVFSIWMVKIAITLLLALLYEWNYWLDAFGYYLDSQSPTMAWPGLRLGAGTQLLQWLLWLHGKVIPSSYHAFKQTLALCGLIGVYIVYLSWRKATGQNGLGMFFFLALFPSILFWSSILGKDPIVLLGTAIYMHGCVSYLRHHSVRAAVEIIIGIAIASLIRSWLAPMMIFPLFLVSFFALRTVTRKVIVAAVAGVVLVAAAKLVLARFGLSSFGQIVPFVAALAAGTNWAAGGSAQAINVSLDSPLSIALFVPRGMFAALFRPLPGEINNPFGIVAGLEGALLVGLLLVSLVRMQRSDWRDPFVWWLMLFVLIWGAMYSVISYQNLGTAVRYRLQVLPAMLLLFLRLAHFGERVQRAATVERAAAAQPAPLS